MVLGEVLFDNDTVDPGNVRRRTSRPPGRSVHGRGRLEYPAGPSADQDHRQGATPFAGALAGAGSCPRAVTEEEAERLNNEQVAHIIRDVWPETPHPALRWRTPLQAAKAGDSETGAARGRPPARRSRTKHGSISSIGTSSARNSSSSPSPPSIPTAWTSTSFLCSRLSRIPVERLDDDRFWPFTAALASGEFARWLNRVARLIDARPVAHGQRQDRSRSTLYGELALDAAGRNDRAAGDATGSLAGVESEPPLKRSANALALGDDRAAGPDGARRPRGLGPRPSR